MGNNASNQGGFIGNFLGSFIDKPLTSFAVPVAEHYPLSKAAESTLNYVK